MIHPMICWRKLLRPVLLPSCFLIAPLTALFLLASAGRMLGQGGSVTELTLPQFRALAREQNLPPGAPARADKTRSGPGGSEKPQPETDYRRTDEAFYRLLLAQGQQAAARESLDRISGWVQAVQARYEVQNAAAVDLEMLQFAEATADFRLSQLQAEHLRARQQATSLLRRPLDSPLIAIEEVFPAAESVETAPSRAMAGSSSGDAPQQKSLPPETKGTEVSGRRAELERLEKELLPQGRNLLAKMYQGYLFGGLPLSALLWQEQQLYSLEVRYRSLLAAATVELPPEKE